VAKRKRLSPLISGAQFETAAPETKSMVRAPIADIAGDVSTTAALDELSQTIQDARSRGRMIIEVPLDKIEADFLVRDRVIADNAEMQTLVESISARGQQTAIEVVDLGGGRYGLISGWRRCQALQQLYAQTGEARFGFALAVNRQPVDQAETYLAMVEENEIRVGLSYYERARIAAKATALGVFGTEKQALNKLYASASRSKRSKIRSFLTIYHAMDDALKFPETLGERLGLKLASFIDSSSEQADNLRQVLSRENVTTAEDEYALLQRLLEPKEEPNKEKGDGGTPTSKAGKASKSDVEFEVRRLRSGVVAHIFSDGRLVIKGPGLSKQLCDDMLGWLDRSLK
jgi:hypothetical protein